MTVQKRREPRLWTKLNSSPESIHLPERFASKMKQVQNSEAPEFTPSIKPPFLRTINGIGLRLLGKKDLDSEGRYLSTLTFTFFFVPVFKICNYRVQDSENGGWYFFSKEKLSESDKIFNFAIGPIVVLAWSVLIYYANNRHPN